MEVLGILQIIFGFLLIFFLPGYFLSLALFPKKNDLTPVERMAYTLLLSISSVFLAVLFADIELGVKTTPENIIIIILVITLVSIVLWRLNLLSQKFLFKEKLLKKAKNIIDISHSWKRKINELSTKKK